MKSPIAPPGKGLFRVRGLAIVGAGALLISLYLALFLDLHLKHFSESVGKGLNSAAVNIGSVRTRLLRGIIELKEIQVADTSAPMKNLLEIDKVTLRFAWGPILRRKLLVEEMAIEGLRHATRRTQSGIDTGARMNTGLGLTERAASTMYTQIRREIGDNPFRHIGQLLGGLNLTGRVEMNLKDLASKKKAETLEAELSAKLREFRVQTSDLKPIRSTASLHDRMSEIERETPEKSERLAKFMALRDELLKERNQTIELSEKLNEELETFVRQAADMKSVIQQDVSHLRNQLNLPKLDAPDLTPGMLGPVLIGGLERISYWVDLARRRMPTGYRGGQVNVVAQQGARGVTVNFGKMAAYPAFLLREIKFDSKADDRSGGGTVVGNIKGITSDPPIYGYPMTIVLAADFPDRGVEKLTVVAQVDHTGDKLSEKIEFSAAKLPLKAFPVNDAGDISLKITTGHAGLHGKLEFEGETLTGAARIQFHDVGYQVSSRFKRIEETVRSAIQPIDTFELSAGVEGTLERLRFQAKSKLGAELARAIQGEFRHQILAVEDDLRKYILDQIHPILERNQRTLQELREAGPLPLEARLKGLQETMTHADKEIARLDGTASNASRKTRGRPPARSKN